MRCVKLFSYVFLFLLVLSFVSANEKYSYENAERLTPLIEWRDYGNGAFEEAREENKPIFLLLTAPSWCYWCQVYESEDYLFNPLIVSEINENFIPIYVDADKRQDLTRKYLEGGWPSTTIMTPDRKRLYGFSGVRPVENMLTNLKQASVHVKTYKSSVEITYDYTLEEVFIPTNENLDNLIYTYSYLSFNSYDSEYGGFGTGQKFPQGRALDFALEMYDLSGQQNFLDLVKNTLKNQYTSLNELETNYNLFDPVEGGFHRYGTARDWSPPHYEKMLYDNARLLKAYAHLQLIDPSDKITNEVVLKTQNYIEREWYDSKNGGFYGNTDVHGEDAYYGKNPRSEPKARVEKTKYSNWNSEAILTYLYLYGITGEEKYREMASKSLDFFSKEMVTNKGVYHYILEDGEKGIQGNILDNSYMLLAFVEGYEVLGEEKYLKTSRKIADYTLRDLYDWNSGGFFERNSVDLDKYALGDNIDLSKPSEENGIMSLALIKLYSQTGEVKYLNSGAKTLGNIFNRIGELDRGYYAIKAAQLFRINNLALELEKNSEEIEAIEVEALENFWVEDLVKNGPYEIGSEFVLQTNGLENLEGPFLILIIIAFISGFISFISPCTLPILPAYVAYTFESSKKNIKGMTLFFFLGLSTVFVLLGMSATFIGGFLKSNLEAFSSIAGLAIMFFGIYILLGKGFKGFNINSNHKKPTTFIGSFLFGGILGISWTPCVGPILVAILLLASTTSSVIGGGVLLFAYALGLALPLILFSTYLSKIDKKSKFWKIIKGKEIRFDYEGKKFSVHTSSLISGLIFIVLGYLIFSGTLITLNQYISVGPFQQWIFELEEKLLGMFG